ncbi:MAG: chromate transporter [Fibrobacteraceae bacterium]
MCILNLDPNPEDPMEPERAENIYWESFKTFFKIGLFTIGGGYAMIPLIEAEVIDRKKWIEKDEFMDLLAIAQSTPGIFAINISIFVGYKLKRVKGAIFTAFGTALPSFLIILLIAMFFHQFQDNKIVAAVFRGIRPAVVALIAVPTFNMARKAKLGLKTAWIPAACALLIWLVGISPILIIILAGICGYFFGKRGGNGK